MLAAFKLGLFQLLAESPRTAAELGAALSTDARATELLLNACVALGLAYKDADRFRNTEVADAYLVPGRPAYMGDALRYADDMYATWAELESVVRSGAPSAGAAGDYLGSDPERTRHFVRGMHHRALGLGMALVQQLDLSGRQRLLDLGGGPGTYAALLVRRHPGLQARVLDLPAVVAVAKDILAEAGLAEGVDFLPGDYHTAAFPPDNDVVLLSGVLHRESPAAARQLIVRAAAALAPGGLLVASDVFCDPGGTAPAFAALFGLNMLVSAPDGGVHTTSVVDEWLAAAGLVDPLWHAFPPPMPHRFVVARRPGTPR